MIGFTWPLKRQLADALSDVRELREEILRWRQGRDDVNRELGSLRTQNVQLHRDNAQLAHQMELVIVQLAMANDERCALLRARGIDIQAQPTFHVEHPKGPVGVGTPLPNEAPPESDPTLHELELSASASLFDDPGDAVAAALGRGHDDFGQVTYTPASLTRP